MVVRTDEPVADEPTVADMVEAECRMLMFKRAKLPKTWEYRADRVTLAGRIDGLLEQFNDLTLGR